MTVISLTQKSRLPAIFSNPYRNRIGIGWRSSRRVGQKFPQILGQLSVIMGVASFIGIFAIGIQVVEITSVLQEINHEIQFEEALNEQLTAQASALVTPELLFEYAADLNLAQPTNVRYVTVSGDFLAGTVANFSP